MEDISLSLSCPKCHTSLPANSYFCFNCGQKVKEPPVSTTILKQIGLYALSFLLPPLGLWPAVKYLKQPDQKSKIIGIVCIILTIVSTIATLWATIAFINTFNQTLNSQMQGTTGSGLSF